MAGIEIDIAANARDFQRGTKDVEAALDGVADALDDLTSESARAADKLGDALGDGATKGAKDAERATDKLSDSLQDVTRDAKRAGDKLGDEIGDGAKDADRQVDKLEASFKDVADASKRESAKASKSLETEIHKGTSAASEDLAELKDEAISNASETFSSFDGSIESLVDGIQGTLGGVISNIGPLGAVAGAAAAVGIGLITAGLQQSAERAAEVREETTELTQQLIEAGGDISKVDIVGTVKGWSTEIADNKEWWELWQDKAVTNLQKVRDIAQKTGTNFEDLFGAMSGLDTTRSLDLIGDMERKLKDVNRQYTNMAGARMGGTERAAELKDEKAALEDGIKAMRERLGIQETSISEARTINGLVDDYAGKAEAAAAADEARADAAGALQGSLDESISSYADFKNAETGALDPSGYINAMAERAKATTNFNSNVQSIAKQFGLTQEETQAILDQGINFAPMLQSIIDSGLSEKFTTQIKSAVGGGQEILDGTPLGATVKADADTGTAEAKLGATAKTDRTATIGAKADDGKADADLNKTASTKRTATITARAQTADATRALQNAARARVAPITARVYLGQAESALNSFINRPRSLTVTVEARDRDGKPVR